MQAVVGREASLDPASTSSLPTLDDDDSAGLSSVNELSAATVADECDSPRAKRVKLNSEVTNAVESTVVDPTAQNTSSNISTSPLRLPSAGVKSQTSDFSNGQNPAFSPATRRRQRAVWKNPSVTLHCNVQNIPGLDGFENISKEQTNEDVDKTVKSKNNGKLCCPKSQVLDENSILEIEKQILTGADSISDQLKDHLENGIMSNGKPVICSFISKSDHSLAIKLLEACMRVKVDITTCDKYEGKNLFHFAVRNVFSQSKSLKLHSSNLSSLAPASLCHSLMHSSQPSSQLPTIELENQSGNDSSSSSEVLNSTFKPAITTNNSGDLTTEIVELFQQLEMSEQLEDMLCQRSHEGGYTPLMTAVMALNVNATKALLHVPCEDNWKHKMVSIRDDRGYNVLHHVIDCGSFELLDLILSFKVDINTRDYAGNTPLHIAAHRNCVSSINVLLAHGARIDFPNSVGRTPLFKAIESDANEAFDLLIANNANIFHFDYSTVSAMSLCLAKNRKVDLSQTTIPPEMHQFSVDSSFYPSFGPPHVYGNFGAPRMQISPSTHPNMVSHDMVEANREVIQENVIGPPQTHCQTKIYDDLWQSQPLNGSCAINGQNSSHHYSENRGYHGLNKTVASDQLKEFESNKNTHSLQGLRGSTLINPAVPGRQHQSLLPYHYQQYPMSDYKIRRHNLQHFQHSELICPMYQVPDPTDRDYPSSIVKSTNAYHYQHMPSLEIVDSDQQFLPNRVKNSGPDKEIPVKESSVAALIANPLFSVMEKCTQTEQHRKPLPLRPMNSTKPTKGEIVTTN